MNRKTNFVQFLTLNRPFSRLCFQTGGYFRYIEGWRITITKWDYNEPRMDQPCVYVDVDGKWKTADCNRKMKSICMKTTGRAHLYLDNF